MHIGFKLQIHQNQNLFLIRNGEYFKKEVYKRLIRIFSTTNFWFSQHTIYINIFILMNIMFFTFVHLHTSYFKVLAKRFQEQVLYLVMLSMSQNVRVCVFVCLSVYFLRYRLYAFLPPLPEVGCPKFLGIWNKAGQGLICRRGQGLCHRRCQALSGI